jgi:hypothetical protein
MDVEEEVFTHVVLDIASDSDDHNCAYSSGLECSVPSSTEVCRIADTSTKSSC